MLQNKLTSLCYIQHEVGEPGHNAETGICSLCSHGLHTYAHLVPHQRGTQDLTEKYGKTTIKFRMSVYESLTGCANLELAAFKHFIIPSPKFL